VTLRFLDGGGAMGAMLRQHDWSASPLGLPDAWPPSLKAMVGVMLAAPQAMVVYWGDAQWMLYNDGYREILGDHHPAIGQPFAQVWAEANDEVGPIIARAYAGQPSYRDDIELVLQRHGYAEEVHFAFCLAPIYGEDGDAIGVFGVITETTLQVAAARERVAEVQRLRETFEQAPSFMAILRGPEHRFEVTNAAYLQLIGHRDLIGKTAFDALPDMHDQGFCELLDTVYTSGEAYTGRGMPAMVSRGAGLPLEKKVIDLVFRPLRNASGQVTGIFVEGIDVTDAHEQALVLRESEERFRTFAQAVPNHVWTSPADGQLDWFNDRTLAYCGTEPEALAGAGWARAVHPLDADRAIAAWAVSLRTGAHYEIEFRIRRADGVYRWHLARALPIKDAAGAVVRWVGTNTDIDDQRADREALLILNATLEQRVEERTRERERIWRNSPDLMAVFSHVGIYQEVNPAFTHIMGWAPHEVVGKRFDTLVHPDDLPSAEVALAHTAAGATLLPIEFRNLHADGSYRWLSWTAAPEGQAIFAFGRDITSDKTQEQALELAEEQLRQSQKMEAVGQLTGGIAHDFNNMLASIYGSIQLMQRKLKLGKIEDFDKLLDRASTSTQRAAALTQRLLAFARRQALDIKRVDVARLIASMDDMLNTTLGSRIALRVSVGADLWSAKIDGSQLENAVLNLVINSRDAMPDGGTLTIDIANSRIDAADAVSQPELNPGDYVALSVTDNGVGMPASALAQAFEPFFTTKPIGQGTGLGLSMVYGFVRQAGGHVRIFSEEGTGTTVRLYLRRDLPEGEAAEAAPSRPAVLPGLGKTILVVEDEANVRAVISAVLEGLGYKHIEAAGAIEALSVLESGRHIDLLVTDVGLTGMNGRQLAEIACERDPRLKVLFLTGYAEQAAARSGFLGERMHMITKPFVRDELGKLVRRIIEGARPVRQ
jgi:PAS domain S-box-containing protein